MVGAAATFGGSFAAEARQKTIKSVFLIELSAQSIQSQSLEWLMNVQWRGSSIQKWQWGSNRVPKFAQHCGNNCCAQNCFNMDWVVTPPKIDFRGNWTDCWRDPVMHWKTVLPHLADSGCGDLAQPRCRQKWRKIGCNQPSNGDFATINTSEA